MIHLITRARRALYYGIMGMLCMPLAHSATFTPHPSADEAATATRLSTVLQHHLSPEDCARLDAETDGKVREIPYLDGSSRITAGQTAREALSQYVDTVPLPDQSADVYTALGRILDVFCALYARFPEKSLAAPFIVNQFLSYPIFYEQPRDMHPQVLIMMSQILDGGTAPTEDPGTTDTKAAKAAGGSVYPDMDRALEPDRQEIFAYTLGDHSTPGSAEDEDEDDEGGLSDNDTLSEHWVPAPDMRENIKDVQGVFADFHSLFRG